MPVTDNEQALLDRIRAATKSVRPRALGPRYREGDGPICSEPGDHGRTYVMASGHLWCPVTQALFHNDGSFLRSGTGVIVEHTAGEAAPPPSLPDIDMEGFSA